MTTVEEEVVKVVGVWSSPYSRKVELALKLKGVPYEYIEEDLKNKSSLLLECNPIHKKIPVLIHNGKVIAESLVILEYIDETWKGSSPILMPGDAYDRAKVRFWSKLLNEKVPLLKAFFGEEEGERQQAEEQVIESLTALEKELLQIQSAGKRFPFLGGDNIGMLDIVGINVALWAPAFQESLGNKRLLFTEESFPLLTTWAENLLSSSLVKQTLPSKDSLVALFRSRISEFAPSKLA